MLLKFKDILKKLRDSKNMTQAELARVLDIPESSIRRYESSEEGLPNRKRLEKMADYFNVSVGYLMGRHEEIKESLAEYKTKNELLDPFILFELVDTKTDDEIISEFRHLAAGKNIDEQTIRNHLAYIRFQKSQRP